MFIVVVIIITIEIKTISSVYIYIRYRFNIYYSVSNMPENNLAVHINWLLPRTDSCI